MYVLALDTTKVALLKPLGEWHLQLKSIVDRITPVNLDTTFLPEDTFAGQPRRIVTTRNTWGNEHKKVRVARSLPSKSDMEKKVVAQSPQVALFSPRMRDLLGLQWEVAMRHGTDPGEHHLVWTSNSM